MSINDLSSQLVKDTIENEVSFWEVSYKYIRNWKWFAVSIIIFMGLAYIFAAYQIPQYKVETDVLIKDDKNAVGGNEKDILKQLDLNSSNKIIDNEVQILKSNTLMEKVVDSLQLQTDYYVHNRISKKVLYKNKPFKIDYLKAIRKAIIRPGKFRS